MRIKFIKYHVIRGETRRDDFAYEKGAIVEFSGWVAETYARAYIQRGYAVEWDCEAEAAEQRAKAEQARAASAAWLASLFSSRER